MSFLSSFGTKEQRRSALNAENTSDPLNVFQSTVRLLFLHWDPLGSVKVRRSNGATDWSILENGRQTLMNYKLEPSGSVEAHFRMMKMKES